MKKVEYLLPFNTKDGICKDTSSFNSLLSSHSDISVSETKLRYKTSNYNYSVSMSEVPNQECSVFHVTFEIKTISDRFREMLSAFRKTVGIHLKDDLQIIWDGVGFEWSKELYPRIYEIENLMRKLISKFMLTNLGVGWHKTVVPAEVKDSIKNTKAKKNHGILYEVDFSQLSNFLFKPYAFKDASKLPMVLKNALEGELNEEKRNEILEFIPKNNWDRYISQIVECESEQLHKKWDKLYDVRCKVAHNNSLTYTDYNDALELCDFLEPILNNAFESLGGIEIPEDEIENISLNTIATVHEPTRAFIKDYSNFNSGLTGLINHNKEVFKSISDISSPISAILKSSSIGQLTISDSLKNTLGGIELTKSTLLASQSFDKLNSITANYNKLFKDASVGFLTGIEGINKPSEISKYFTSGEKFKFDEDNEE